MTPERQAQLDQLLGYIVDRYVFAEVASTVAERLAAEGAAGAFDAAGDDESFSAAVTERLIALSDDRHLRLQYSAEPIADVADGDEAFDIDAYRAQAEAEAFGVAAVQRLDGNVGYLDFRILHDVSVAAEAMSAALRLVAHTDSLIVDLRRCPGGSPFTVSQICSSLFDERTHLNDIRNRAGDATEFWTNDELPEPRFGGTKPIWVLTSAATFSGGEELAFDLQALGRAVIVGELTRGGANPGSRYRVAEHLQVFVPSGQAVNPKTGTNWEGVGVIPDLAVDADSAFDTAYRLALDAPAR